MLESSHDACSLGVILCFLSIEVKMSDGFRQQDFRVLAGPWKAQHPLTGDGVVLVPIHWVFLLQVHDLLIKFICVSVQLCFHVCRNCGRLRQAEDEKWSLHPCLPHLLVGHGFPRRWIKSSVFLSPIVDGSCMLNPLLWVEYNL